LTEGIPLCDVTTMLAFLEPSVLRGYQVIGGVTREGWGLREGLDMAVAAGTSREHKEGMPLRGR